MTFFPLKRSTLEEARGVQEFLKAEKKPPSRLVLVTNKTHTRRARMIFRRILRDHPIEVLAHPTSYDDFDPVRWWSRPKQALHVLNEYVKLCVNSIELLIPVYDR